MQSVRVSRLVPALALALGMGLFVNISQSGSYAPCTNAGEKLKVTGQDGTVALVRIKERSYFQNGHEWWTSLRVEVLRGMHNAAGKELMLASIGGTSQYTTSASLAPEKTNPGQTMVIFAHRSQKFPGYFEFTDGDWFAAYARRSDGKFTVVPRQAGSGIATARLAEDLDLEIKAAARSVWKK